jgi:2-C-methyl-D-erythritol 2,4-cyclodiphosphate synthase
VLVPHSHGLVGHSDGDVVAHAIADALLGAAAQGDLGEHFPPGEARWRGVSGAELLGRTAARVAAAGYAILQVDVSVVGEAPRLAPFRDAMRRALAIALGLAPGQIGLQATTPEGLGPLGARQGLLAQAVVLLRRSLR